MDAIQVIATLSETSHNEQSLFVLKDIRQKAFCSKDKFSKKHNLMLQHIALCMKMTEDYIKEYSTSKPEKDNDHDKKYVSQNTFSVAFHIVPDYNEVNKMDHGRSRENLTTSVSQVAAHQAKFHPQCWPGLFCGKEFPAI